MIRLNKYLSSQGIASRRKIDDMISHGRVFVNNELAELGQKINPETDTVVVDKKIIPPTPATLVYYAFNKPKYVLSTTSDTHGRKAVTDYVPGSPRVFPVGRLDFESTGLILLTNDGELTLRLTHPRFHLPKTYLLTVLGKVTAEQIHHLASGVELEDGKTAPADVKFDSENFHQTNLKVTLYQGKKRQVRRMCAALHLFVIDLHRLAIGSLSLGDLAPGQYRPLTPAEISSLKRL